MKVTCPQCKRRTSIQRGVNNICKCGYKLNYRYFLHKKISYETYLVDANVLIYALEGKGYHKKYCYTVITFKSPDIIIATTGQILQEVGPTIQDKIPDTLIIYTIKNISQDLQELKTNFLKQPSPSDLSLVQAAYDHPEVKGIITYDKDFKRIATSGLVERRSSAKFWLGDAKQFVEKQKIKIKNEIKEEE
ncbi:MAG: type II toxin-antitoxin system VapC family toxin [Candidatus Thermoplasmatota archaeon]